MHVLEKSDCAVVPVNQPNKAAQAAAEVGEGRAQMKENIDQPRMLPTQSGTRMSQGLDGVRKAARERKQERFTSLLHHLTTSLLRDSFYALQRQASPGIDGVTWQEYESGLEDRLTDLHSRVQRGTYRAQPSRRVYIPKADGRQRPLGVAALEDKIVQHAVVTILNQIYEVDFRGFSYGFRPGRSPHQALDALAVGLERKKVNWVLDADILGFFDNLSHEWAVRFIEHRVADRRIIRLIQKWLKAGVSEDGQWSETKQGTPQGAVVSPLIANVYLHYVFDLWADVWRRKAAQGDVIIVRYADDLVMGFQQRADAERFLEDFRERLAKFGLQLHPEKTRLIEFGRYAARDRKQRGIGKPETFNFLGFTHYCGQRHKTGTFTVKRITAKKRMVAKLKAIKAELQHRQHHRSSEVGAWLRKVVNGYYQYHAVPGNLDQMRTFRQRVAWLWRNVLVRRSQRARKKWELLTPIFDRWIPRPRILHPYPQTRFYAIHPS
ncbi:MAG: group II intron reverse transcriptase/maturase [Acidobacteria bacterium]|jgi:group II intron reverse transcriptase/maturase|nr:group II intron reverse transcriptase/maturase [Acidobacteriota bacterium]